MPGMHPRGNEFRSKKQARMFFARNRDDARSTAHSMSRNAPDDSERKSHPIKGLPNKVGKRATGGSFESGPSTIVRGVSRGTVRRGRVGSSRYGGTPGHGRRFGPEAGLEHYAGPPSRVAKGVFTPTTALSRAGKLGQALDTGVQTIKTGVQAGQAGAAPAASAAMKPGGQATAMGRTGKVLLGTGQKLGQATSTPMRTATTGGAIGAAGTAATMGAMNSQKDPNQVGKALVPDSPDHRRQLANQAREMNRSAVQEEKRQVRAKPQFHGPRPRNHDPEAHRQRRLGAAQATANVTGGAALASGASHLRQLNREAKVTSRTGSSTGVKRAIAVDRKGGRLIGVGLAGFAAGEKIRRHANDPRNRAWR